LAVADDPAQLPGRYYLHTVNFPGTADLAGHDLTATPCVPPYTHF
jgi:hypothetical protein